MSTQKGPPEIVILRIQLERNRRLKLEFQAAVSVLLRTHDVEVSDELIGQLTVAVSDELPGEGYLNLDESTTPQDLGKPKPPQPPKPMKGKPPQPPKPMKGKPPQPPSPGRRRK